MEPGLGPVWVLRSPQRQQLDAMPPFPSRQSSSGESRTRSVRWRGILRAHRTHRLLALAGPEGVESLFRAGRVDSLGRSWGASEPRLSHETSRRGGPPRLNSGGLKAAWTASARPEQKAKKTRRNTTPKQDATDQGLIAYASSLGQNRKSPGCWGHFGTPDHPGLLLPYSEPRAMWDARL